MTTFKFNDPHETRFVVKHRSLDRLTPEYIKATTEFLEWFRGLDENRKNICMFQMVNFIDEDVLEIARKQTMIVELME